MHRRSGRGPAEGRLRRLREQHARRRWTVVAQADNGRDAARLVEAHQPDVVVLDLSMPELNGLDATRQILDTNPEMRVLILTAHESEQLVREVLSAGARGYVLKSDAGRTLVRAVEALLEGYLRGGPEAAAPQQPAHFLSARERQIVQLLAEGASNKDVARSLGISVKTAETHRSNIMRKMQFESLSDLVRYAVRNKIIEV